MLVSVVGHGDSFETTPERCSILSQHNYTLESAATSLLVKDSIPFPLWSKSMHLFVLMAQHRGFEASQGWDFGEKPRRRAGILGEIF
eukprot:1564497-Rhodomonas_salina.1